MITQTSELAIKAMIYLTLEGDDKPLSPRKIAKLMDCSPSYLAKIMGDLAKAGLLDAHRGARGGVVLARAPEEITLLSIIEACQGLLASNYCKLIGDELGPVCGFHKAMWEVYMATRGVLQQWTLRELTLRPLPHGPLENNHQCHMAFLMPACAEGVCEANGALPSQAN